MRITTTTQQQPGPGGRHDEAVVVCLQAQHVAGLPAAAEGRKVQLRCLLQQPTAARSAASVCRGGVAAFHGQVLLLDLMGCTGSSSMVTVEVTVGEHDDDTLTVSAAGAVDVNLAAERLGRRSPNVLTFVLGGGAAVLSLALHHRLVDVTRRRRCRRCMMAADLLMSCLRVPLLPPADTSPSSAAHHPDDDDSESSEAELSSSGFITIEEKGTIHISGRGRRRPPSDNLLTTDDDDDDSRCKVEDEFLAMLDADDLWDLDALIKDADADLAGRPAITTQSPKQIIN